MKRKAIIISTVVVSTMLLWHCADKFDSGSGTSLKESLSNGTVRLNKAIDEITATTGYRILSMGEEGSLKTTNSDSIIYLDSILLDEIKGIYEYQLTDSNYFCHHCFRKLFVRTGESDQLVVSLPEEKVFHPYRLHNLIMSDSILVNNFTIMASDYHYYFARGFVYDYKLSAGFKLDDEDIGSLDVQSASYSRNDFLYKSTYWFNDNYSVSLNMVSGDTTLFGFALLDGTEKLLEESLSHIHSATSGHGEREYHLTIGNVEIVKEYDSDSILIYMDGILQQNASVEFIDVSAAEDESRAICRKNRDIQITFDDGSVATLSELIGPSMEILENLSGSLQNMYFASGIVDYIAWNIYMGFIN